MIFMATICNDRNGRGIRNHCFRPPHALACRHACNRICSDIFTHNGAVPVYPFMHSHAKYRMNEETLILEIAKEELYPWLRVPAASYLFIAYRAGDLRDIYDDHEIRKSKDERQAAMERFTVIKHAKGPMLKSQLVAEACEALLASGSLKGSTFSSAADAPSTSAAPCSSGDPQRRPEPLQGTSVKRRVLNRSQGHLFVRVLNLGHWERPRERSTPQCFHHLIDWDATCAEHKRVPTCGNLFLHFLSNISAHVLIMQEASTIRQGERERQREKLWSSMAG